MLSLPSIIIFFAITLLTYTWYQQMRAKEIAFQRVVSECGKRQFQLLDHTVALQKFKIIKQPTWHLFRQYSFDYTANMQDRLQGQLQMNGLLIIAIRFADVNIIVSEACSPDSESNVIQFPTSFKK